MNALSARLAPHREVRLAASARLYIGHRVVFTITPAPRAVELAASALDASPAGESRGADERSNPSIISVSPESHAHPQPAGKPREAAAPREPVFEKPAESGAAIELESVADVQAQAQATLDAAREQARIGAEQAKISARVVMSQALEQARAQRLDLEAKLKNRIEVIQAELGDLDRVQRAVQAETRQFESRARELAEESSAREVARARAEAKLAELQAAAEAAIHRQSQALDEQARQHEALLAAHARAHAAKLSALEQAGAAKLVASEQARAAQLAADEQAHEAARAKLSAANTESLARLMTEQAETQARFRLQKEETEAAWAREDTTRKQRLGEEMAGLDRMIAEEKEAARAQLARAAAEQGAAIEKERAEAREQAERERLDAARRLAADEITFRERKAALEAELARAGEAARNRLAEEQSEARARLASELEASRASLLAEQTSSRERLQSETAIARAELLAVRAEIEAHVKKAREGQTARELEAQVAEAEARRHQAMLAAEDADFRRKRSDLEASIGEIGLKRIEAESEYQRLVTRRQEVQAEIRAVQDQAARKTAEALQERESLVAESQRLAAARAEAESGLAGLSDQAKNMADQVARLTAQAEQLQQSLTAKSRALETLQSQGLQSAEAIERGRTEALARAESDFERRRAEAEQDLAARRSAAEQDFSSRRAAAEEAMQQRLQGEFEARAKQMNLDVQQARLREMERIEGLLKEQQEAELQRRTLIAEEVVERAKRLASQGALLSSGPEFKEEVRLILEGKFGTPTTAQADQRSRDFWRKGLKRASIPVAAVVLFALFPSVPGRIAARLSRSLAPHHDDSGVFLEQIRQKSLKFQPETDRVYRESYADNLLYLTDYAEMKFDEQEQKAWTLALNRFLVGDLGLNDQLVVDFVASESVLVKDLFRAREGILPQYMEQGLAKLNDAEKQGLERLLAILRTPENYQKFRALEKATYEHYVAKRKP